MTGLVGLVVALTATACSGGSGDKSATRRTTTTSTPRVAATTTTTPSPSIEATTASVPTGGDRLTSDARLGYAGLGPIKLGMDLDEALRVSGVSLGPTTGCERGLFFPDGTFAGVDVWQGPGARVDTLYVGPPYQTISGIHVGSSRAEVLATYPNAQPYGEDPYDSETLEISNREGRVIVFLFRDGIVIRMILAMDHLAPALHARC